MGLGLYSTTGTIQLMRVGLYQSNNLNFNSTVLIDIECKITWRMPHLRVLYECQVGIIPMAVRSY